MLARIREPSLLPTHNILLGQLNPADRALIGSRLGRVSVESGAVLMTADTPLDAVYFPETVLVSIGESAAPYGQIEIGLVGLEGLVGWPALLGSRRSGHCATVQAGGGTMLRLSACDAAAICRSSPTLLAALLRFVDIVTVQMAGAIVSNLCSTTDQRLARWLLMRHDRLPGDELQVRHEEISAHLGVRRASITDALHILEGELLIRCHRGRVLIRDRERLRDRAGASYGAAETYYSSVVAPFGRSRALAAHSA